MVLACFGSKSCDFMQFLGSVWFSHVYIVRITITE